MCALCKLDADKKKSREIFVFPLLHRRVGDVVLSINLVFVTIKTKETDPKN